MGMATAKAGRSTTPLRPADGGSFEEHLRELLHAVFPNSALVLLFGGTVIGFASKKQGDPATQEDHRVFLKLFGGLLRLFVLEMEIAALKKPKDLKRGGRQSIVFGLITPKIFAAIGIVGAMWTA